MSWKILTLSLGLLFGSAVLAAGPVTIEGHYVFDSNKKFVKIFNKQQELVIDHMGDKGYEVYGPKGTGKWISELGLESIDLNSEQSINKNRAIFADYPTPEEIEKVLKDLLKKHSNIMKLESLGKSNEGRDVWAVKISDNVNVDEVEPEVKYIANMHGNEIVGRELMVILIKDILESYQKGDQRIKNLVDNREIYIVPTMNPDGSRKMRRGNAKWIDLNRDFPDFTTQDNQNTPDGREPETKSVMKFQARHNFSLSANFHGGAEVVNYPWDTTSSHHPLEELIIDLSTEYANEVPGMHDSRRFPGGIVNGYRWYEVDGGMQDWSYNWHGDLQVTIELSNTKWPNYSEIDQYYTKNRESLFKYLERVDQGLGFKSVDKSLTGTVKIKNLDNGTELGSFPFGSGEFYKVLSEANYSFEVKAGGKRWNFRSSVRFPSNLSNGNYKSLESL
ncbi:MAG: succinylglutamate desuccinylase/aspartoacylase family protein [Bacteriovoracaceae bacterium]|nr:succinylglutamate desuccinylase/aspartoacylase family protein [Bacteriovoracaceae bacterium]